VKGSSDDSDDFHYDPHLEEFKRSLNAYLGIARQMLPELIALRKQVAESELRDDFAKFALEGMIASREPLTPDEVASWAYRVADAMLVARKVVNP
jgi:hypothetical protein